MAAPTCMYLRWDHEDPQHEPQDNTKYGDPPMVQNHALCHLSLMVEIYMTHVCMSSMHQAFMVC
eukprot:2025847-Amphidinium_carterae.1